MILVGGLSPAWQQIMQFPQLRPGEVNRADHVDWCASGKVLNVAKALGALNADARTVATAGGLTGQAIQAEFVRLGLTAEWIETAATTRVCTTLLDRETHRTTELVENSPAIQPIELQRYQRTFQQHIGNASTIVLTGSLPTGTPETYFFDLLAGATAKVVLDVRGVELRQALARKPFVVKPNREELSMTVGHALRTDGDLLRAMRQLNSSGADWVVVTQGPDRVLASSRSQVFEFFPPRVNVVNPIGCGDCLTAGLAFGLEQGLGLTDALSLGIAAASQNAQHLFPARVDLQHVTELAASIAPHPL